MAAAEGLAAAGRHDAAPTAVMRAAVGDGRTGRQREKAVLDEIMRLFLFLAPPVSWIDPWIALLAYPCCTASESISTTRPRHAPCLTEEGGGGGGEDAKLSAAAGQGRLGEAPTRPPVII
jgi:hypothetical protein